MQEVLENFKKQLSTMTDEDFKCFKSVIESETQRREAKQVKTIQEMIVKARRGVEKFEYDPSAPLKSDVSHLVIDTLKEQTANCSHNLQVKDIYGQNWNIVREEVKQDFPRASKIVFTVSKVM